MVKKNSYSGKINSRLNIHSLANQGSRAKRGVLNSGLDGSTLTKKGSLIVIEGIDGAGVETQGKLLTEYFKAKKRPVERLYYPDYGGPIGNLLHQYLYKKYDFTADVQFLLYSADFVKDREKIKRWLSQGKLVLCDRYFTSTLAYQGLRGFSIKKALEFAEIFELPIPDLVIYLKVSPEVSIKRKYKEKRELDRNEANKKLLFQATKFYEKLLREQIFGKWVLIDGEKTIEEVFEDVKKIIINM